MNCTHWSIEAMNENSTWRGIEGWGECQIITREATSIVAVVNSNEDASLYTDAEFSCSEFLRRKGK